jgi:RNA recognition motif-containing protein
MSLALGAVTTPASQPERRQTDSESQSQSFNSSIRAKYSRKRVSNTRQTTSLYTKIPPIMATTTVAKTNSSNMATEQRVQPNQSLYIQNLPEKLQKPDLKRSLYMLFSTFGPVLDVTAVKSSKMRGQAHVLFRDIHAATQAMRACQGMEFFGREMVRCN